MTDVAKKPDFNTLTFAGVRQENNTPAPVVEAVEVKDEKKKDGAWIYAKSISDVTVTEFKEWLSNHVPRETVDSLTDGELKTPAQKSATITRVANLYGVVLCLPRQKKKGKNFSN